MFDKLRGATVLTRVSNGDAAVWFSRGAFAFVSLGATTVETSFRVSSAYRRGGALGVLQSLISTHSKSTLASQD